MKTLTKFVKQIPQNDIESYRGWYNDANKFAQYLSDTYKVSFDRVCAVISALSPAVSWKINKQDAERLITCYACNGDYTLLSWSSYSANVVKAWNILIDYSKNTDEFFNFNTGAKTLSFYHNIKNPTDGEYVTIDRHMVAVLSGATKSKQVKLTPKQYRLAAADIKKVAAKYGLVPCELQAVCWEYYLTNVKEN